MSKDTNTRDLRQLLDYDLSASFEMLSNYLFYIKWAPWYFLNNKKMFPIIPITRLRLSLKWILLPATHSRRPPVTVITKEKKPTGIIDCHTYWQTSGNYSGQISLEIFSVVFYLFSQNWGYWLGTTSAVRSVKVGEMSLAYHEKLSFEASYDFYLANYAVFVSPIITIK